MNQRTKKIIAREVLIFFLCLALIGIFFFTFYLFNNHNQKRRHDIDTNFETGYNEIRKSKLKIEGENKMETTVEDFAHLFVEFRTRELYDTHKDDNELGTFDQFSVYMSSDDNRRKFYKTLKDKIEFGSYEKFSKDLGYKDKEELKRDSDLKDLNDKLEILRNERTEQREDLPYAYSPKKFNEIVFKGSAIIAGLIYPIRLIIWLLIWAIKTLRED